MRVVDVSVLKDTVCDILSLKWLSGGKKRDAIWLWLALGVWLPYVLSAVILIAVFFVIILTPQLRRELLKEKRMLVLSCAIAALSFISSVAALNIIGMLISFGVCMVLICGCFLRCTTERVIFNKCSAVLAFGSVAAVILAVIQRLYYGNNEYRPTAGAFNANYYGALIVFTLILSAMHITEKDTELGSRVSWYHLPRWVWMLVFALNLFALMYSRSRSSLLAMMVCALIYLILSKHFILSALCCVGSLGVWAIGYRYPDLFNWSNSLTFIFEERLEIWRSAWSSYIGSARSVLIGRGPMTYYLVKDREGLFSAHHAHNILFDTLLNVGALGTVLYVLLLADMLKASFKAMKAGKKEWLVSAVVVAEILIQGVADVTIMWIQTGMMFMLVAFPVASDAASDGESLE